MTGGWFVSVILKWLLFEDGLLNFCNGLPLKFQQLNQPCQQKIQNVKQPPSKLGCLWIKSVLEDIHRLMIFLRKEFLINKISTWIIKKTFDNFYKGGKLILSYSIYWRPRSCLFCYQKEWSNEKVKSNF